MAAPTTRATLDDLMRTEGKAELIGGRIVHFMPTGRRPNKVAGRIYRRLDDHASTTGAGEAYTDNMGFAVPELLSGRESFSPDASYYAGPFPANEMRFIEGGITQLDGAAAQPTSTTTLWVRDRPARGHPRDRGQPRVPEPLRGQENTP